MFYVIRGTTGRLAAVDYKPARRVIVECRTREEAIGWIRATEEAELRRFDAAMIALTAAAMFGLALFSMGTGVAS